MAQATWKKYLTEEQYGELGPDGRMLADYWTQWLPKMCRRMHAKGELIPTLQSEADRLAEMHVEMLQNGMYEYEAMEFIKQEVYALPPEK